MKKSLTLYSTLAQRWLLLSHPKDYKEEANIYADILIRNCHPLNHVLERGSGGGNNASHLKKHLPHGQGDHQEIRLAILGKN